MKGSRVYFLRPVGADGPVKIGTSAAPWHRLATYANWSPIPLEIAAEIEGGVTLERRFHAKFRHLHSHHEWFRASPDLTATIAALRAGRFDIASLPPPHSVVPKKVMSAESIEAGVLTRRMEALRKAGVPVPPEVYRTKNLYLHSPEEVAAWRARVRAFVLAHDASPVERAA